MMLALSVLTVACGRDAAPKMPRMADVLPNVPLPPQPTFVSRSGGEEALQLTVRSPVGPDEVAAYYRQLFKTKGWRIVNDARDQEGVVVLFAEQDGPPLWIRIRGADDGQGSLVDIAGARATQKHDSLKPPAAPLKKPSS